MQRFSNALGLVLFAFSFGASAQVASLRPYVSCHFSDGLALIEKGPTPPANGRTAITLTGPKDVAITRGEKLVFAYPGKMPFARVTIEQLPAKSFDQGKADLVSAFDKIIASDENVQRNYSLKAQINGFDANGLDRKELDGAVVGIYLLVDNEKRTVVSIDFLNQAPDDRSFSSMAGYGSLRDAFLSAYTSCVRANQRAVSAAAKPVVKAATPAKKVVRKS